jgi:hypothetical protein
MKKNNKEFLDVTFMAKHDGHIKAAAQQQMPLIYYNITKVGDPS